MRALHCVVRLALLAPLANALLAPRRTNALTNAARVARSRRGTALAAAPVAGASSKVFAAATGAVSRLVVTTALGAATVKANIVTPDQINGLAKVVYNFFLPCFLFTTLIRTVATYGLSPELLLLMPFAACAQIAIAFLVSRFLLVPLVGVKPRSAAARELTLSGSFGNPGVLPLLFFDALFAGARDASLLPRLVALTSFYLIGFTPAFWALGNAILADDDPDAACLVVSPDECEAPTRLGRAKKALTALLKPPPVRAALGGLAVAACTPLRDALVGPNARLANVFAALTRYSGAYLPSASLVLAGSLIAGGGGDDDEDAPPGLRRIVALCLHRFCLLPALGAGALFGLASVGLFPAPGASPLVWFFLLTQRVPVSRNRAHTPPHAIDAQVRHAPGPEHGRHVPAPRRPQSREAPGAHTARRLRGGRRAARVFVQRVPDRVRAERISLTLE